MKENKNVFLYVVIALLSIALAGSFLYIFNSKNSSDINIIWKEADSAPRGIAVRTIDGEGIEFSTNDFNSRTKIELFEDPSCTHCAHLHDNVVEGNQYGIVKPLSEEVSDGNSDVSVHLMTFMDNNTGANFSHNSVAILMAMAENGAAKSAWQYYNMIWPNQQIGIHNTSVEQLDDIINFLLENNDEEDKKNGISESIQNTTLNDTNTINENNKNTLVDRIGSAGTPTMFVNGDLINNPDNYFAW